MVQIPPPQPVGIRFPRILEALFFCFYFGFSYNGERGGGGMVKQKGNGWKRNKTQYALGCVPGK